MAMAEPSRPYNEPAPRRPHGEPERPEVAGLERRAVPMTRSELLPMAAILLMVAGLAALLIVYLTALGRMTAQGVREQHVDRRSSTVERQNEILKGRIARLSRRDRIEQEAHRLGLQSVTPQDMERLELPAGSLDGPSRTAAAAPAAPPAAVRRAPATKPSAKRAPGKARPKAKAKAH